MYRYHILSYHVSHGPCSYRSYFYNIYIFLHISSLTNPKSCQMRKVKLSSQRSTGRWIPWLETRQRSTSIEMSWTEDTVRRFRPSDLFQQSFSCLRSIKIQIVDSTQTLDSSLVTNHYSLNINAINRYNKSIQVFDHHHRSSAIPPENKINSGSTKRQQLMQPMAKHLAIKPPNHSTAANPTQNKSHHPSWNQTYKKLSVSEDSPNTKVFTGTWLCLVPDQKRIYLQLLRV